MNPKSLKTSQKSPLARSQKLRKIKDLQRESRCLSDCGLNETKTQNSSRTRSVSPSLKTPPLDIRFPLKKFYKLYSKIIVQLETVKTLSDEITNEAENMVDLKRQIQRAEEFSIRFSRNNLYETKRIINEIKKSIVPYPFERLTQNECRALCRKIIIGYQTASQSLQFYIKYAKNPFNLEVPEKIKELVILIADLFLCCEHFSLPPDDLYIQNDAVKTCNDLIDVLNTKINVLNAKDGISNKQKKKVTTENVNSMSRLSMYKNKLSCWKGKTEITLKKKQGKPSLLGKKARKLQGKEEKRARITHEIYTQKLNPVKFGNKNVKFEPLKEADKVEEEKKNMLLRKRWRFTPREVKSQDDDDVETMVQAIGDEDFSVSRLGPTPLETDEGSEASITLNKSNFRELLLEAIKDLQTKDKKGKESLKKLLCSIQSCSRSGDNSPKQPRVKVIHVKSADMMEEEERKKKEQKDVEEGTETEKKAEVEEKLNAEKEEKTEEKEDLGALHRELKEREEKASRPRKLNVIFKPLWQQKRKTERLETGGEDEVVPKGKIKLNLPEEMVRNLCNYRKAFKEFRKNNIMYTESLAKRPWDMVAKISDEIILDIIKEVALDLENDDILNRLYLNELLELGN